MNITAIPAVNISTDFMCSNLVYGHIHSVFKNTINLIFAMPDGEDRILTLTKYPYALTPNTLSINDNVWRNITACSRKSRIKKANMELIFVNGTKVDFSYNKPYSYKRGSKKRSEFDYDKLKKNIDICKMHRSIYKGSEFGNLPHKYKTWINEFAFDLINKRAIDSSYKCMLGAGKGLTPSSDDAVIGVLSVVYWAYAVGVLNGGIIGYRQLTENMLNWLINDKKKVTTDISVKYLKCACRGKFSYYPNELVNTMLTDEDEDLKKLLKNVTEIGHSSGKDMLEGILIAMENLIDVLTV